MSFKKGEKPTKVSYVIFKRFLTANHKLFYYHGWPVETKVALVFALLKILLFTPHIYTKPNWPSKQLSLFYKLWLHALHNNCLVAFVCQNQTKHPNFVALNYEQQCMVQAFCSYLHTFFTNSKMLNIFTKNKKRFKPLRLKFDQQLLQQFLVLNEAMKKITLLLKKLLPTHFHHLINQIVLLG